MAKVLQWSFDRIVKMIVAILLNKFDGVIVIEGNRGLGKSTLAYLLARAVSREFRKLYRFDREVVMFYYDKVKKPKGVSLEDFVKQIMKLKEARAYYFNPTKCLLYQRHEVIKFFHRRNGVGIADEMINVTFNRDFYNEEQKDLIKMINMNRDHSNLFIPCVPLFQNLDSQMKNLCKIRLTVVRRGVVVIQTPNRTIYSKDKWDQATNEKIEKEWIKKGIQNPHYAKLTTFRGIARFPPLTAKQEDIYQQIKDEKRNIVAREQMGIIDDEEQKDDYDKALEILEAGRIRNAQVLDGMAMSAGKDPEAFKRTMVNRLKRVGKPHRLSEYYWENKEKDIKGKEQVAAWRSIFKHS
jgi:hypothetical protein